MKDSYKGYKIRQITPADNPAVATLIRYNLKKHGLDIPGTVYFDACVDDLYHAYAGREGCGYFVLVDEADQLVGGIGFDKAVGIPGGAELQKMYLDDRVKGQGLSYFLIGFIEERMRRAGMRVAYLETHTNLQVAIHVYEKMGYRSIERPAEVEHGAMDHFYRKEL